MTKLILRWNTGENSSNNLSNQAYELLEYSIKFCKLLFKDNNVRYYVCYNNLKNHSEDLIMEICEGHSINPLDVTDRLPAQLKNNKVKNSWWKYAIPRADINSYEIILDNDILFWEIPPTLSRAIKDNALVALQDGVGKFYGDFSERVNNIDPQLSLNAGLLGCPPGFQINPIEATNYKINDYFFSEQGFTALKFAKYKDPKYLIPLSEIQQLNANRIIGSELIINHNGGHFCGCSYDIETFWTQIYSTSVKKKYKEMMSIESYY